jgi:hypothetical protein
MESILYPEWAGMHLRVFLKGITQILVKSRISEENRLQMVRRSGNPTMALCSYSSL